MDTQTHQDRPRKNVCHFRVETLVRASAAELFHFHENPQNISVVMPPTTQVVRVQCSPEAREGDVMVLEVRELGLVPMTWKGRWKTVQRNRCLVDELLEGPFRVFEHHHVFEEQGGGLCRLTDEVHYAFGSGILGRLVSQTGVRLYLHMLFAWRHYRTRRWANGLRAHSSSAPSI